MKVKAATSAHSMADLIPIQPIQPINCSLRDQRFNKTKRKYILHTTKKTMSVTLAMYLCFNNIWQVNITDCTIQSWPREGLRLVADRKQNKNKPQVDYEPCSAHGRAANNGYHADRRSQRLP